MGDVVLNKSGGFGNLKKDCKHKEFNVIKSVTFTYVVCKACGKVMGEVSDKQ